MCHTIDINYKMFATLVFLQILVEHFVAHTQLPCYHILIELFPKKTLDNDM